MEDNQQNNHDSAGDWDHDPEVEESEDDNDWWNNDPNIEESEDNNIYGPEDDNNHDPNDIDQVEKDNTVRRRTHNMGTRRNRQSIVSGLPSTNNGTGLNGTYWMGPHICPTLSVTVVA